MDFKELFKKFWFVMLIALAFLVFVIYYGIEYSKQNTSEIKGKVVDGKNVIYSIDDENYYSDDLFETLNNVSGANIAYEIYRRDVISNSVKTTSEMQETASNYAAYILQTYGEEEVLSFIKQSGYSSIQDLSKVYLDQLKENEFITSFVKENESKYVDPIRNEYNPRLISHILVKVEDVAEEVDDQGNTTHVANPNDDEKAKLDEVLEALKTKSFAEVATEYSEDGSASNGGLLGVVGSNNASNYVPEFAEKSMELKAEEVSEVITTTYGYHILYCQEATLDDLLADQTFNPLILDSCDNDINHLVEDKAKELKIDIKDENLKNYIDNLLNGSEVSQ